MDSLYFISNGEDPYPTQPWSWLQLQSFLATEIGPILMCGNHQFMLQVFSQFHLISTFFLKLDIIAHHSVTILFTHQFMFSQFHLISTFFLKLDIIAHHSVTILFMHNITA